MKKNIYVFILFFVIGISLYGITINSPFVFDDYDFVINNPRVRNFFTRNIVGNLLGRKGITYLTFAFNYYFGKNNPLGYHLFNTFLHIFNAYLLFICLKLLLLVSPSFIEYKKRKFFAVAVSLIFLVHPLQTQAVSYIWERTELLAATFFLLGYIFYLKTFVENKGIYWVFLILSFILGIFAKETVIALPLLIFISDRYFFSQGKKLYFWRYFIISLIALLVFYKFMPAVDTLDIDIRYVFQYWLTQPRVIIKYLQLFIFPLHQNLDYYFPLSTSLFKADTFIPVLILLSVFFTIIIVKRKHPLFSFGIVWFLVNLLPTSIIPLPTVIFEHRMYLPLVGMAIITVGMILHFKKRRYVYFSFLFIFLSLSFLTVRRNLVWTSPLSLMKDTVEKSPLNARPHFILGTLYYKEGRYDDAYKMFIRAIRLAPLYPDPYNNLGLIFMLKGNDNEAERLFKKAISLKNDFIDPYINLSFLYAKNKQYKKAKRLVLIALRNIKGAKNKDKAYIALSNIYLQQGRIKLAKNSLMRALEINPGNAKAYYNLGNIFLKKMMFARALYFYKKALSLDNDFFEVHLNMGVIYYKLGKYRKALASFAYARKINPYDYRVYKNLANLYFAMGRQDLANEYFKKSVMLKNR